MNRRVLLRTVGGLSTVGFAGCSALVANQSGDTTDHDVGMSTMDFRPEAIDLVPGKTVVWKNTSSHAHTVTAYEERIPAGATYFASGGFDTEQAARDGWLGQTTGAIYSGDTFEHTFTVPGTYTYFCVPHEQSGMVGTVVVHEPEQSENTERSNSRSP